MSSVEDRIRNATARNKELLRILAETDHAVPALDQQQRYIADLQNEVTSAQKHLTALETKRKKELKDHEGYRDSVMKRFAFKVSGKKEKFEQRAAKEEREYFEVLQEEHQATEMKKRVDQMLADAIKVKQGLDQEVARHSQAQGDLDRLYDSIFKGPSPGFPEEDAKESEANTALQQYQDAKNKAEAEGQAVKILTEAERAMRDALLEMNDALRYSTRDMFGGGTFTDMMERNALSQAESRVAAARMLVRQAQRFSPAVKDLPPVHVAQGNLMSDVFFDNIFTDMMFHQKIEQSAAEMERGAHALDWNLNAARSRHVALTQGLQTKVRTLEQARLSLQKAREAAFERIAAGGHGGQDFAPPEGPPPTDLPPPYSA
jgi:hypothetical protein